VQEVCKAGMKIFRSGPISFSRLNPLSGSAQNGANGADGSARKQNLPSDEVLLSRTMGTLLSALTDSPAHTAKISELSTAVASGGYHVDSYLVSGSIIEHTIRFGTHGFGAAALGAGDGWALSV